MKKSIIKTLLIVSLAFIGLSNGAKAQTPAWEWQNPLPQGNNLNSVYFTDTDNGYAVGNLGTILKTTNAGISWTAQSSGTNNSLRSVYFTDVNTGYVVDNLGTILKTTNAGTNWTAQTSGTNNSLFSVYFTDTNNGYAVGNSGTILKTTNAGISWTAQASGTNNILSSVYFTDANTGYAVGNYGTILKTTNAGVAGINENMIKSKVEVFIYPNPATNTLNITGITGKASIKMYDMLGKLVMQKETEGNTTLDTSTLPQGIYIIETESNEGKAVNKVVINAL